MAGGYENEDVQAELEELRRKKEAQMRAWMDEERRERAGRIAKRTEGHDGADPAAPTEADAVGAGKP